MAIGRSSRAAVRVALVLALTTTSLVGAFPQPSASPRRPTTIVRSVRVDLANLAPRASGRPVAVGRHGVLRTTEAVRTAAARVCAPFWFTGVGVTWEQGDLRASAAEVAVSRDGSAFGRIREMPTEGRPDPGSGEPIGPSHGTNLLWTGGARCVRVALDLPGGAVVRQLNVVFVNASGTGNGPSEGQREFGLGLASLPVATAMTRRGRIFSRNDWGADPRLMNCTPGVAPELKMGFLHHTAGTNRYSRGEVDDIIRAIYAFHTNGRGWCDIAYNFLVDRFGRVWEGRSGGITVPVISAATQGFNTGSFSAAAIGNSSTGRPTSSMMRAIKRLFAWRLDVGHLPPRGRAVMVSGGGDNTRYPAGTEVKLPVVAMHRTTGYTDCPGRRLAARLDQIRDAVERRGLPKIYRPRLSSNEVDVGVDLLRIKARGTTSLTWSIHVEDASGARIAVLPGQTGDRLDLTWEPTDTAPYPRQAGTYEVVVRASDGDGRPARTARLAFGVKLSDFEPG